ncbi:hypothetical protein [uncultured Aquabacterium sp.]|uniref:hypothetical protein n=1 Tax=uncultured Aquabacterium sp. TaxID=158753 RepID=UPI0030D0E7AF|tara:strand:- start:2734 stop:3252 length:519 start_codon:yes stop_codon:yes gene_type:complete
MNVCKRLIVALSVTVMTASAHAAKPSAEVVDACLQGESRGHAIWTAIETNEVGSDDDFRGGHKATLFTANGRDVGYAEKDGRDGLIWGRTIVPLRQAAPLDQPPETPSTFTPMLADWSIIQQGSQRFLCVNFNFDGLGRSGSFQKVHGLYLMSLPQRGKSKPALFYGVRRTE